MIEECVLIERAKNGETSAFRELVERNKKNVYYLALDLTGNHHDAEDLSQEVFIKAYRNIKDFRSDSKLSSWLYRITVNTNINQYRKKSHRERKTHESLDELSPSQQHVFSKNGVRRSSEIFFGGFLGLEVRDWQKVDSLRVVVDTLFSRGWHSACKNSGETKRGERWKKREKRSRRGLKVGSFVNIGSYPSRFSR